MPNFLGYTKEDLDDFEEVGELYVCPFCDLHGHADRFGDKCPNCGEDLENIDQGQGDINA